MGVGGDAVQRTEERDDVRRRYAEGDQSFALEHVQVYRTAHITLPPKHKGPCIRTVCAGSSRTLQPLETTRASLRIDCMVE